MKKVILSLLVLAAAISFVEAAPFQTMGMLRTPDAYILPHKAAEFQFVNYLRQTRDTDLTYIPYGMVSGGLLDRVELGMYAGDNVIFGNIKVKLLQETLKIPQLSVGLENIFSSIPTDFHDLHNGSYYETSDDGFPHPDRADYEAFSPYVVMSKQAVLGGVHTMFNIGVGMHRFVGQVHRSRLFSGSFASFEVSPVRNFSILGEYDGRDFNGGLKYSIDNFSFKVGYQAIENLFKESEGNGYEKDRRFALSISYLFDKYASAKRRPDIVELARIAEGQDLGDIYAGDQTTGTEGTTGIGPDTTTGGGTQITTGTDTTGQDVAVTTGGTTGTTGTRTPTPEMQDLVTELQRLQAERARAEGALQELRDWINSLRQPSE